MPNPARLSNARYLTVVPPVDTARAEALDALASHCIAARRLILEHGSPVMRSLVDLLLHEVGDEIASGLDAKPGLSDRSQHR